MGFCYSQLLTYMLPSQWNLTSRVTYGTWPRGFLNVLGKATGVLSCHTNSLILLICLFTGLFEVESDPSGHPGTLSDSFLQFHKRILYRLSNHSLVGHLWNNCKTQQGNIFSDFPCQLCNKFVSQTMFRCLRPFPKVDVEVGQKYIHVYWITSQTLKYLLMDFARCPWGL